jgi:hypothetical protein
MQATYHVPETNLDLLKHRLAKITRRCNRIKVQAPVLTVGAFEDITYKNDAGFDRVRRVYTVTLDSIERPKIDGFEFAAVISPVTDEDGKLLGNILRLVPGFEGTLPERFRQAMNHCDHCNTNRYRLETFVIANAEGFKQVGRNCLANYLGLTNPHMLAELAQILIDADDLMGMSEDEGGFGGGRVAERFPVDDILQLTASAIRQYGWLSNKSAQEFEKTSTSNLVREWAMGSKKTRDAFEHALTISDADKTLASETEAWLETLATDSRTASNDYLYNLSLLAQATSVTGKNFGILVSAINAFSKEKEFVIRRNARIEADSKSEFIGTIGERITIENATVVYTNTFETQYGVTHFFKFKVGDNVVVYFASNKMFEQGEVIPQMTARVKAHENRVDNYNPQGVKQTIITRATLPKPPKPELTPEQKIAKKAITKLNHVMRTLPNHGPSVIEQEQTGQDYKDYLAWSTIHTLIYNLQREYNI